MPTGKRNLGVTRDPSETKTRKRNLTRDIKDGAVDAVATQQQIVIDQPVVLAIGLEITGTADLIQNRFSQKAVEMMLKSHMGISVQRERKIPREVLEDATVKNMDDRVCIKPSGIKLAMLSAAMQIKGLKKTQLRTQLFVQGKSVPITFEEQQPGMDIVRLAGIGRTPDIRFRPYFSGWKARIIIEYSDNLNVQTVVDLLNRAGSVGVGEWRPEKNGEYGTFRVSRHISDPAELGEVAAECAVPIVPLRIPAWALDQEIDAAVLSKMFSEPQPATVTAEPTAETEEDQDAAETAAA